MPLFPIRNIGAFKKFTISTNKKKGIAGLKLKQYLSLLYLLNAIKYQV